MSYILITAKHRKFHRAHCPLSFCRWSRQYEETWSHTTDTAHRAAKKALYSHWATEHPMSGMLTALRDYGD